MSLPSNFALLALSPTIRNDAAFLFLQTGTNGYIDMFIQSATGSPVNIMTITSGVDIANTVYVNTFGNDSNGQRGSITRPFASIGAALNAATAGDTIEVFPGSYEVSGNMYKDSVNFYFHKKSYVSLESTGKIDVNALTFGYNIYGDFSLTNNSSTAYPIQIYGYPCNIEFASIDCGTGKILISGLSAGCRFQGLKTSPTLPNITTPELKIEDASLVKFEDIDFYATYFKSNSPNYEKIEFKNCIFETDQLITSPCAIAFTGQYLFENCQFNSYVRLFTSANKYSEVKKSQFLGGVLVSGHNYFDDVVFNTRNLNVFPNNAIISNFGGYSIFKNCGARNFNNTSYLSNTYIKSGTASGSNNFNIANTFTSFRENATGTTVNYGTFSYNTSLR